GVAARDGRRTAPGIRRRRARTHAALQPLSSLDPRNRRRTAMNDQPRMNVESFNLDHRTVAAPYLRIADRKELPGGDVLTKFDVRFTQPNTEHLDSEAVHSLEHMMAEHM